MGNSELERESSSSFVERGHSLLVGARGKPVTSHDHQAALVLGGKLRYNVKMLFSTLVRCGSPYLPGNRQSDPGPMRLPCCNGAARLSVWESAANGYASSLGALVFKNSPCFSRTPWSVLEPHFLQLREPCENRKHFGACRPQDKQSQFWFTVTPSPLPQCQQRASCSPFSIKKITSLPTP